MNARNLAGIIALACVPCNCSRSAPPYASPTTIKSQFPDQFTRIDYYAQNFTKLTNAVPFPPIGADDVDKRLFQIPAILNVSVLNESISMGIGRDSWSRESLNRKSFWLPPGEDKLPRVAIGKASTAAGKEIEIAEYSDVVIEPKTGNRIRITIDFDLAELKKHAETRSPPQ